jgi:hypothetical protein
MVLGLLQMAGKGFVTMTRSQKMEKLEFQGWDDLGNAERTVL